MQASGTGCRTHLQQSWIWMCVLCRICSCLNARINGDPVHLPSLSSVCRERLLEPAGVLGNLTDHEAQQDGSTVEHFLVVEFATPVLEFANRRCGHRACRGTGEIQAPLVRVG